jgi:TonB family protein
MNTRTVMGLCCFVALIAQAAPLPTPIPREPPPEVAAQPSRKLPKLNPRAMHTPPDFRQPAVKEQASGRVLLEFQIDRAGAVINPKILASDAAAIYQERALVLVQGFRYDVTDPIFDANDPTPFRLTVEFCLPACQDPLYPGTNGIRIALPDYMTRSLKK